MAEGSTVPAVDILAGGTFNLFGVEISHRMINSSLTATAPIFKIEDEGGGGASVGVKFNDVVLEQPGGGGIELRSINRAVLEGVTDADLPLGFDSSQPIPLVGKSSAPGSLVAWDVTLIGCTIVWGSAANPSVKFETGPAQTSP